MNAKEKWDKEHMKRITAKFKIELVDEFRNACNQLEKSQSQIFRKAMKDTIEEAKQKKLAEGEITK